LLASFSPFSLLAVKYPISQRKKESFYVRFLVGRAIIIALFSLLMLFSFLRLPMSAKRKLPISSIGGSDSSPLDYRRCLIVQYESRHRLRDVWLVIALMF
jgi:hypothetical protein